MTFDRSSLRSITLADNFDWLRSFGCTVEQKGELVLVDHLHLPEYRAWLLTGADAKAIERVRRVVSGTSPGPRRMYVDDEAATDAVAALLARARRVGRNITVAARVPHREWRSTIGLVRAAPNEWQPWSELYSRGFGREDRARVDAERWRLAFASATVQHWFFVRDGRRVGVCQTTVAPVHGIYSFTFLPEARGVRAALNGIRALLGYLSRQPSPWIYFEVLSESQFIRRRMQSTIGLSDVRVLRGYELQEG